MSNETDEGMGARGDCVLRHGVVARAWLAGCLRATSGNTADTAWQYCPGSRSDTPPRQALAGKPIQRMRGSGASYLARWSTDTQPRRSGAVALPGAGARLRRDRRKRKDLVAANESRIGERGPVPGAQAGAILPGSIGSIARGCAEGIGARSTRAPISIRAEI